MRRLAAVLACKSIVKFGYRDRGFREVAPIRLCRVPCPGPIRQGKLCSGDTHELPMMMMVVAYSDEKEPLE